MANGLLDPYSPGGLLDPGMARRDAFLRGLGALGSHLISAGAPSTDPGNFGRQVAMGGQAMNQAYGSSMDQSRQYAMQDLKTRLAMEQYKRDKQKQLAQDRLANAVDMGGKDMAGNPVDIRAMAASAAPGEYAKGLIGAQFAPPDLPNKAKEYQYAVQNGYNGDYMQYINDTKQAGVTVNTGDANADPTWGTAPNGMVWARTQQGDVATQPNDQGYVTPIAVPIAGTPDAQAAQQEKAAAEKNQRQKKQSADIVVDDIGRALKIAQDSPVTTTGVGGYWLNGLPGTSAYDLKNLLDTVRANVGFERLQQMRDASPTGGALGQVSEMENRLLQGVLGNLEQSQSSDQFTYNLKRLYNTYNDIVHGPGRGPKRYDLPNAGNQQQPGTSADMTGKSDADLMGILGQ